MYLNRKKLDFLHKCNNPFNRYSCSFKYLSNNDDKVYHDKKQDITFKYF